MKFYASGIGDNLMNPVFFTGAIHDYLLCEKELLISLSEPYDTIIEIGCTKGRYAETITKLKKHYLGIDIAKHHILDASALHQHNTNARFLCDDVRNLETILLANGIRAEGSLLFFPFNSFGNLHDGTAILQMLKRTGIPFAIFTYATDKRTEEERTRYYTGSGFLDICLSNELAGVRFIDHSGLNTIAYRESWFRESFLSLQLPLRRIPFGGIGCSYLSF
jgi:hypothetical protein